MMTHLRKWAVAVAALALLAGGLAILTRTPRLLATSAKAELPDPPFARVPDDFPRFIPVRDAPSRADKAAFNAYRDEWRGIWKFLAEGGVVARARPEEREAVASAILDRFATAKSLGLKILRDDAESIPALYALARARVSGDANIPDGLFLIRRARRIAERRGQANPGDGDAREWYMRTLWFEYSVLVDIERNEEAIRAVENLEKLYEPLPQLKVWPLFKLLRLDDAEAAIRESERSDRFPKSSANDRLALEGLRHHRKEQLEAARAAARHGNDSPVIWANGGGSALSCFLHAEAEADYLRAVEIARKLGGTSYSGSPFTPLSRIYVQEGRPGDAIAALLMARSHRAQRGPKTLGDDQGEYDISVALAMLALGRSDDAERFARRVFETPDRLGHTSDRPDDKELANAVVLWTVLAAKRARREERGGWGSLRPDADAEAWTLARLAGRIARQPDRPNVLRPYVPGSATIESWQLGTVLRMVPPGVALTMVDQARREEEHPDAAPYFDALEAEARLLANDPARALSAAREALDRLPKPGEVLLRGRTAALAAEAARRLGRSDESRELWSAALADFPAAPRLLGLAVPIKIQAEPGSRALADLLAASPRFRVEAWGLPLKVRAAGGRITIALGRGDGSTHAELEVALDASPTTEKLADARDRFLDVIASPTIHVSAADVNALDGLPA
jgi:tetratricopeptide (TPR) repeat protein